jgi:transposase-like protein
MRGNAVDEDNKNGTNSRTGSKQSKYKCKQCNYDGIKGTTVDINKNERFVESE